MSFDVLAAIELASAVSSRQPISQTLSDASTLYTAYQSVQAKTFDPVALAKAGKLEPTIAALSRATAMLDGLLNDKTQGPRVVDLLQSLKL